MSVIMRAMDAHGTYSKVNDVYDSYDELKRAYNNPNLTPQQKVAQCTAEASFMSARCGELCTKDPIAKPFINAVATISDVGRAVIKGYNEKQPTGQILLKTATAALSGAGETIVNFSQSLPVTIFGFALSMGGLALNVYQRKSKSPSSP